MERCYIIKDKSTFYRFPYLKFITLILGVCFSASVKAQCINVYPHVEDFETAATWTSFQFFQANSWAWGTPAHPVISTAGSGTKSWCMGGLTGSFYPYYEQSWVQSPCYDFTNLQYPHVWVKVFWESEWKYDGTKLQSSIDNGATWVTVGAYNDPNDCNTANWYNTDKTSSYTGTSGPTGSNPKPQWFSNTDPSAYDSWAGNTHPKDTADDPSHVGVTCYHGNGSTKWLTAQHCLTGLAGQPNVIFRMAFSCGFACNGYDGFAFDSIAIGNGIINTTTIIPTCGGGHTMNFSSGAKACPTTTWAWNFGDGQTSTLQNPSHTYAAAGVYTVNLIASGGACNPPDTMNQVVHVLGVSITSFTNATCTNPGAATALAASGTTPTYSWSNGATTATATGLTPGTYTVTVKDPSNPSACPTTTTVTITQPNPIVISLTSTAATCNSNNGTASTVSISGGTPPYNTFSWSPSGGNAVTATNLAAGLYSLTVTDAAGCTGTQTVQVNNSSGPQVTVTSSSVACFGASTGTGNASATGGTAPITYSWSTGATTPSVIGLSNGSYTVVVTDASPCAVTKVITIAQPTAITSVTSSTAASCGKTNGMASITVTGGTPGYTYTWSPSGGNASTASGLGPNTYTITGVDANACTYSAQVVVTQQSAVNVSVTSTPATCGNSNGSATATATGGFPGVTGYTYIWTPTTPIQSSSTASNLASGVYNVSVADSLGCATTTTVNVGGSIAPVLTITSTSITCNGLTNGTAAITINGGTGTSPFTYTWSPSGGNNATASNLGIGSYTCNVTDANTCTATATTIINQPAPLVLTPSFTNATCGLPNGSASCLVTGGVSPYKYIWTSGSTNPLAPNLLAGTYSVTVTDNNGCQKDTFVTLTGTPPVTLSVPTTTNVTCNGGSDGSISVTPQTGTRPFTYSWLQSGGTDSIATNLTASTTGTTYTVLVKDANNCPASAVATIFEPDSLVVNATGATICLGRQATIGATYSGENGQPFSYTWTASDGLHTSNSSPNNSNNISDSPATSGSVTYTISVQDSKGCPPVSKTTTVTVLPKLNIAITTNKDSVCPGQPALLSVIPGSETGGLGVGSYTVTWLPKDTISNTLVVYPTKTAHTYTAVLTDGCTVLNATAIDSVILFPTPPISYSANPISGCAPLTVTFTPGIVAGMIANDWTWHFNGPTGPTTPVSANGIATYTYNNAGSYYPYLTGVTTDGHCPNSSGTVDTIHVYLKPVANFYASTYTTDLNNNTVHFYNESTPTSATQTVYPAWVFVGQGYGTDVQNPSYTFYPDGTYSVTLYVSNNYGCIDSVTEEIVIIPDYTFYAPNCFTPNGDGVDEVFLPLGVGWDLTQYNLWVFDRWGVMFYHTQSPYVGWNGTRYEHQVQEDTYVWKVHLYDVFGKPHTYHGTITVVR